MVNGGDKLDRPFNKKSSIKTAISDYWGIWIFLGVLLVFFIMKITTLAPHIGEEIEAAEAGDASDLGAQEYVGSERCKDCHWEKYNTWKNTLHSKFMQVSSKFTVLGDFKIKNRHTVKVTSKAPMLAGQFVTTSMFTKNGKFYINTTGPDWEPHDYEITNVIGIGRRQNYITKFPNGEMHVLPVEWDAKKETWVGFNGLRSTFPGEGEYWSDQGQIWQFKCGGCHVTGLETNYDKARDSFSTNWADLGVACEACHGPGGQHVKAASVYFEGEKDAIVNPAKLPWRLRAMVCGQCHNRGTSTAEISPSKEGFPEQYSYAYGFRAGEPLYNYYTKERGGGKKHHQQYNEWRESEHAKTGVMCTNCHSVHKKEDIKVAMTKLTSDSLCMDCHKTLQRRAAHRIHTFGSCVACHMPTTVEHEHSHTFKFISPEQSIIAGGVDKQPNSCNGCHHHKDTPPENLLGFLDAAKKEDMPKPFNVHRKPKPKTSGE
jgi:predicted CXXCH cytochrome family protein